MEAFSDEASKLPDTWPAGDLETVREAMIQWEPLETCEGKLKIIRIMSRVLTTARFTLEGSSSIMDFEWPDVRPPPSDHPVAQVQRVCYCEECFAEKFEKQFAYSGKLKKPAKELLKLLRGASDILKDPVFAVNSEMEVLSMRVRNIVSDAVLMMEGILAKAPEIET